jgi:hypothetical protein
LPVRGQTSSALSFSDPQEASEEKDPAAIFEIGTATSWNVTGGAASFASNFAIETTPIENWLELQAESDLTLEPSSLCLFYMARVEITNSLSAGFEN